MALRDERPAINSLYWKYQDGIQRRFSVLDFNSSISQHLRKSQVLCSMRGVRVWAGINKAEALSDPKI